MTITAKDLEGAQVYLRSYGNRGLVRLESGRRINGYSRTFGFEEYPRLRYRHDFDVDWSDASGPSPITETWIVDGVGVGTLESALEAASKPPVFTEEEAAALDRIPRVYVDKKIVMQLLSGLEENPNGEFGPHDDRDPWGAASKILSKLADKDAVEYEPEHPENTEWRKRRADEAAAGRILEVSRDPPPHPFRSRIRRKDPS